MDLKPDVLVVGAGICGTALAIALRDRGLSVLLVERDARVRERFKGEYLQPVAVRRLEKMGIGGILSGAVAAGEATAIRNGDALGVFKTEGLSLAQLGALH